MILYARLDLNHFYSDIILCKRFYSATDQAEHICNLISTILYQMTLIGFEVGAVKHVLAPPPPQYFITDFIYIIFSSVWVAKWPSFGKELLTRLTICSLCILTICNFSYFLF